MLVQFYNVTNSAISMRMHNNNCMRMQTNIILLWLYSSAV